MFGVAEGDVPQLLAGCGVVSEQARVLCAAEHAAVGEGYATVGVVGDGHCVVLMRAPFFSTGVGVNGDGVVRGGEVHGASDDDGAGLEAALRLQIVAAEFFQARCVCRSDFCLRGEALAIERAVIAWPVGCVLCVRGEGQKDEAGGEDVTHDCACSRVHGEMSRLRSQRSLYVPCGHGDCSVNPHVAKAAFYVWRSR